MLMSNQYTVLGWKLQIAFFLSLCLSPSEIVRKDTNPGLEKYSWEVHASQAQRYVDIFCSGKEYNRLDQDRACINSGNITKQIRKIDIK